MRSSSIRHRWGRRAARGASTLALAALVACAPARRVADEPARYPPRRAPSAAPDASTPPPVVTATAVVSAGEPAAPAPASPVEIASFSDPSALAELARDPLWHPERAAPGFSDDVLSCATGASFQSCVPGPCPEGVGEPCRAGCARACRSCDESCRPTCSSCARACTDDRGRRACARSCAACLDACRVVRDRCFSGECARHLQAGAQRFERDFVRACQPTCRACYRACDPVDSEGNRCLRGCLRRRGGCNGSQFAYCVMTGPDISGPEANDPRP